MNRLLREVLEIKQIHLPNQNLIKIQKNTQLLILQCHKIKCHKQLPSRVARLKFEKIAKFNAKNSQNSQMKIKNSHKLATFYNLRTTDMWHNSLLFVLLYMLFHKLLEFLA